MSNPPNQSPYPSCDDNVLWDLNCSLINFPTLLVADELGLFALLAEQPLDRVEIGSRLSLGERPCEAMLGILTSLQLLACREGRYYLTQVAQVYLVPDSPYYRGGSLALNRKIPLDIQNLKEAMLQDKAPALLGTESRASVIEQWQQDDLDPETAKIFTQAMHSLFWGPAQAVSRQLDIAPVRRLLDVGGGSGCFSIALTQQHPDLHCTVWDLPPVCEAAKEYIDRYDAGKQVETMHGDMFQTDWPKGYDGMFFGSVFHDWDADHCRHLAQESFLALPPGGRIFLHEMLLDDSRNAPLTAAGFSMLMVFHMRGKQYSAGELRELLEEAGYVEFQIQPTFGYHSIVSATKPGA